jgi:hypothetical protein
MALVPPGATIGDCVYVIGGLEVPFLTREKKAGRGEVELVGECYVHGIMDGEAKRHGDKVQLTLI